MSERYTIGTLKRLIRDKEEYIKSLQAPDKNQSVIDNYNAGYDNNDKYIQIAEKELEKLIKQYNEARNNKGGRKYKKKTSTKKRRTTKKKRTTKRRTTKK
jgi:ATP-dependent Clp protease ATP-binding subunit ClpA